MGTSLPLPSMAARREMLKRPPRPHISCRLPSLKTKPSWSLISKEPRSLSQDPASANKHYCAHKPPSLSHSNQSHFLCLMIPPGTLAPAKRKQAGARPQELTHSRVTDGQNSWGPWKSPSRKKGFKGSLTHPLTGADP